MSANDNEAPSEFLDERSLCALLAISSVTATKWRAQAKGPPFIKVGRLVRYRRSDVDAWLRANTVGHLVA
jgi:excisionase family DNA binding protein